MTNDDSIGVLFIENPSASRGHDLVPLIITRESHPQPPPSTINSRYSTRLRKKFAENNNGSTTLNLHSLPEESRMKLKLYYNAPGRARSSVKRRRLKENDVLPRGVGVDEQSALIVKVLQDVREKHGGAGGVRKGVAGVVRGLAVGVKAVGNGLGRFADCLSGTAIMARHSMKVE